MVWSYLQKLIVGNWENLKIPDWLKENHSYIISNLHNIDVIKEYAINHDCGKHLTKTIDSDGKVHYPKHEEYSCNYWLEHFPEKTEVSWLILNDMFFHTCSSKELEDTELSKKDLFTLLLTSLAEIHANAELFGGIDSTSFKIKFKQINRRGMQLCKQIPQYELDGHSYVFVRGDLTNSQIAVQSGHSLIEICQKYTFKYHPSLVYLVVKSEFKLKTVMQECLDNNINFSIFREPDINNEITAIATEPLSGEKRTIFRRYQLLK